jgi:hypothetical protein
MKQRKMCKNTRVEEVHKNFHAEIKRQMISDLRCGWLVQLLTREVCKLHNILKGLLGVMNENECWKTKKEKNGCF